MNARLVEAWALTKGQYAITTDGTDDYISTVLYLNGAGPLTVSGWFATTETATATNNNCVVGAGSASTTAARCHLGVENGKFWGRFNANTVSTGSGLNDGEFHSFVFIKPQSAIPSGCKIWIDGTPRSLTTTGTSTLNFDTSNPVSIGVSPSSNSYFTGAFDDIRVYFREVSENEAQLLSHRRGIAYEMRRGPRTREADVVIGGGAANYLMLLGVS